VISRSGVVISITNCYIRLTLFSFYNVYPQNGGGNTNDVIVSVFMTTGRLVSAVERDDVSRLKQVLASLDEGHSNNAGGIVQLAKGLYIAAARGHLHCARLLLDAGAQPNIRGDTNGNTPVV